MFIAPFKAIRPQPQKMKSWINRQIGDSLHQNTEVLDFLTMIQPESNNTAQIRKGLQAFFSKKVLVQDSNPSLYLLEIQYGNSNCLGLIGCIQTRKLKTGEIKPHEDVEKTRVKTVKDSDLLPPNSTDIKPKPLHGLLIFDFLSQ